MRLVPHFQCLAFVLHFHQFHWLSAREMVEIWTVWFCTPLALWLILHKIWMSKEKLCVILRWQGLVHFAIEFFFSTWKLYTCQWGLSSRKIRQCGCLNLMHFKRHPFHYGIFLAMLFDLLYNSLFVFHSNEPCLNMSFHLPWNSWLIFEQI